MDNDNLVQLEYEQLVMENGKFNAESLDKICALIKIQREGNVIFICHPKHLFDTLVEDSKTKQIQGVDLDSMNVERMLGLKDYGRYSVVEQICSRKNNQYTYIMKKANHMNKSYREKGVSQFSYPFAIVEMIDRGLDDPEYFFRGILSCNQEGFSIAFAPFAVKSLPRESVWQKGLHFGDNYN